MSTYRRHLQPMPCFTLTLRQPHEPGCSQGTGHDPMRKQRPHLRAAYSRKGAPGSRAAAGCAGSGAAGPGRPPGRCCCACAQAGAWPSGAACGRWPCQSAAHRAWGGRRVPGVLHMPSATPAAETPTGTVVTQTAHVDLHNCARDQLGPAEGGCTSRSNAAMRRCTAPAVEELAI